ncbi:iron-sulfur cluster carrier protein ApbC [Alteromonas mediterranea]|jgi:ATP-binding protein involved in chromosome partitioning|uniref:Iron-sulfur cluster carrier protein n=1 Tax=Alteromonas mediterranea TaxID=314275 RepID=A0AAC8XKN5_9ALTE|nr:iron-sulfur cluster carrier protein ApbC [Alteromonas mediterranea]MEA3379403.1 iron-sulfur cluster carrier protein ApbC [Pseudomonadota bacterium]AFV85999.1 ATP-binding protein, Mrp/Nbp35 family [Alteromonas mediterranea DE1]AGP98010.1 Mrp/Nbp35 family ATP-binding protein [Alteromonas mediterranea UM7]AGQ02269.1 Mrp/Nbp35 family ATP-binding protein [Alteromonas mediterranea UM4b]AMJ79017.1 ATP-binding protein [Alteromonas mediterranea]
MFFSRKAKPATQKVAAILATYFSVDVEDTLPWCAFTHPDNESAGITVTLPFCIATQLDALKQTVLEQLESKFDASKLTFKHKVASGETEVAPVTNIKNIIAVASGKGGVGKSTTSINLAFALMQEGAKVGILDADIYGPSIPIMLGNPEAHPESEDNKHMQPLSAHGLVANSIGYLVPQEDAAVWRGPMASRALKQLLDETLWPVLDYLIVDMPPGTGDIQLTMAQQVPLTASVVVTTPQDLALADAQKGISMFEKVNVPVLGLIENMSYYQCRACGTKDYVFAKDGGEALAERHGLPLLGQLPLDIHIREHGDAGTPLLITSPDSPLSESYREAARALSMQLALTVKPREGAAKHIKGDPIGIVGKA